MLDKFNRKVDYVRISLTKNCNLACEYCRSSVEKIVPDGLSFDEVKLLCETLFELGITKFKLTGGEPLLRPDLTQVVRYIKSLSPQNDVTLTTNAVFLHRVLDELVAAGLDGMNVSLDSLVRERFNAITRSAHFGRVVRNICKAKNRVPTKLNVVLKRGFNDDEILKFVSLTLRHRLNVRFIEMMPMGTGDLKHCISNDEVLEIVRSKFEVETDERKHGNGPAKYFRIKGAVSSFGLISPIHGKFCESCNRIRISSDGIIKGCLFYKGDLDLKPALSAGDKAAVKSMLVEGIYNKPVEHRMEEMGLFRGEVKKRDVSKFSTRESLENADRQSMSGIGG